MHFPAEFFVISGAVNFLTSFFLGSVLLIKSAHIRVNRIFALSCFAVAFWSLFYAIQFATKDPDLAMFFLRTDMVGSFFIPVTHLHFFKLFLKRNIPRWFLVFNYAFACIGIFIAYTPLFAYNPNMFLGFLWLQPGPFFHVYFLYFVLLVVYSFWCMADTYKKSDNKMFKRHIRFIYTGFLIGYLGGSLNYGMWYRIPVLPVTCALVSVYVFMVTYAILKHQLFDLKIIVKNSLVYSVLASIITIVYFVTIYVVERLLKGLIGYESIIASSLAIFVVGILFLPVKNLVQMLMEKYLFKATYAQIAEQNERLKRQVMISQRYKTFSELTKSMTMALRNPLTVLKTYTYHLPQNIHDPAFLQKFSDVLKAQVQEMEDITGDLSKYSAPEPLMLEKTNLYALLTEVLNGLQERSSEQNISVHCYYNMHDHFWLDIDPKKFKVAITNIILNSFKTMPSNGQLWVGAEKADGYFTIFVKDTGEIIPQDQLEKIFDPFYRYHEDHRGLDLAIAFSIIENHGGKVSVESSKESGNEYIIQLPIPGSVVN